MTAVLAPPLVTHYEELVESGVEPEDGAIVEVTAGVWSAAFERADELPGQSAGTWWLLDVDGERVKRTTWADATFADGAPVYVSQFFPVEVAA